jgi:hypothetical protein
MDLLRGRTLTPLLSMCSHADSGRTLSVPFVDTETGEVIVLSAVMGAIEASVIGQWEIKDLLGYA